MDISKCKGIKIPEGNLKSITIDNVVVWSIKPAASDITINCISKVQSAVYDQDWSSGDFYIYNNNTNDKLFEYHAPTRYEYDDMSDIVVPSFKLPIGIPLRFECDHTTGSGGAISPYFQSEIFGRIPWWGVKTYDGSKSVDNIILYEGWATDYTCLAKGTKVTLADRSIKNIEDISYEDTLLVWNFDKGILDCAKPAWIMREQKADRYNKLTFSDGSVLKTINQHRIFNKQKNMFTYPMTDDTPIGSITVNDKGEFVTLVSKEVVNEPVLYYNIITEYHYNLFTSKILTSCRLNNLYAIEDMKFVKDDRIIKPKEDFPRLSQYEYEVFRAGEYQGDINSGSDNHGDRSIEDYIIRCRHISKER